MSRYTAAYSDFIGRLGEVDTLRRLAAEKERSNAIGPRHEINALCRGAVVLLCGHLEAFVRQLGEIGLDALHFKQVSRGGVSPRLYYHISQDLISDVQGATDPEKIANRVFAFLESDLVHWSKDGPFPQPIVADRFNQGFANPGFKKIKKYFHRFGYRDYAADLARKLRADYQPTVTMVDHLVDTRNKIAHGDPDATMTPSDVASLEALTRAFCRETDVVFAAWWAATYCPIR